MLYCYTSYCLISRKPFVFVIYTILFACEWCYIWICLVVKNIIPEMTHTVSSESLNLTRPTDQPSLVVASVCEWKSLKDHCTIMSVSLTWVTLLEHIKVKVWVLAIALLAWAQQCFAILEVAADWHGVLILRRIMQPSIAHDNGQLDLQRSTTDIPPPQLTALGLHSITCRLLLFNWPRIGGKLRWCLYTAAKGGIWPRGRKHKSGIVPHGLGVNV